MKKRLILLCLCIPSIHLVTYAQKVALQIDQKIGKVNEIHIEGDTIDMNWILQTDGTQYPWVKENYGWGLGYFTEVQEQQSIKRTWTKPIQIDQAGMEVTYQEGNIRIQVSRKYEQDDLLEYYTFTNIGDQALSLYDVGVYTPFNDNYPSAQICIDQRAHAHIWAGGNAAYVNALRMGAYAPHLGLQVFEGAVRGYEVWERGRKRKGSQYRGVITLNPSDMELKPGASYTLAWRLFSHQGNADFYSKLLAKGSVVASADKYVYEVGETARITFESAVPLGNGGRVTKNGVPVTATREGDTWTVETSMDQAGEVQFDFLYDDDKHTQVNCLVFTDMDKLILRRTDFIRIRQQMNYKQDERYGAYMVYDNEADSIYLNDTPNVNPVDRDEGAERVGMGILMEQQYARTQDPEIKASLMRYADFLRNKLQAEDYTTYSSVDQKHRVRAYNFIWIASFYFRMYHIMGDQQYAEDGYQTMQAMYKRFGHGFYAIDIPVQLGLQTLKKAGMEKEYQQLKADYIQTGDVFIKNGLHYPAHEVNYEQSIVAPSVAFLTQLYLETKEGKYLDEAKRQLPLLEAFNGQQPSFHLNDIAIRHWDGFWFGKREMFGDTFPHYWSAITASAFKTYYQCTGDERYLERAKNIVRNNLCLFTEDGRGSAAYMYPDKINGVKAAFYDPYANDQDWAMVFYMSVFYGL